MPDPILALDHLAVSCTALADGVAHVEALLGVPMAGGGQHPAFGTHNRLISLGPDEYLEVIAIDPAAPPPPRPRWFGLDAFTAHPCLTNWILRTGDLDAALDALGPEVGAPMALSRGEYRWRMAVPQDGALPFENRHPALMGWDGPHPAAALPDEGLRLTRLTVSHPRGDDLAARLTGAGGLDDPRIHFRVGASGLAAVISTPRGDRVLA